MRFTGSVRLPNVPRPGLKICIIADAKHEDEVKKNNIECDVTTLDTLKKFNKDKKLVKRWAKKYHLLLASDSVLKKVPVVVGPILNRIQRFPAQVNHNAPLANQVTDARASIKFQLKKVTCMNNAVGNAVTPCEHVFNVGLWGLWELVGDAELPSQYSERICHIVQRALTEFRHDNEVADTIKQSCTALLLKR